jgi:hypothetical protein
LRHQRPLARECHKKKQDLNNKFKGFSQIVTTRKTKNLLTILPIFAICKDTWFVDSKASQHLIFQKEVFLTFEKFSLNHKIYFGNNNTFDVHAVPWQQHFMEGKNIF